MTVSQSDTNTDVDCKTLDKKLMMGYQGWFGCAGDGSKLNCWWHWSVDNNMPNDSNLVVDMWPDATGLEELFPTGMTTPNGTQAALYSAYSSTTVDRHFEWMKEYNLDGVMLQRFVCDLRERDSPLKTFRDQVALNVKTSAEKYGRAFCVMYDISESNEGTLVQDLEDDWAYLVDKLKITASPAYLKHKKRPLLAIWGLGFKTRPGTASQANDIITYFKTGAPDNYRVTLLGGVPSNWRTPETDGDSKTDDPTMQPGDQTWLNVYRSFDVLSPWTVGDTGADNKTDRIKQDLKNLKNLKDQSGREIDYMPIVFPGYSFKNTGQKQEQPHPEYTLNQIPRDGGRFWWRQVYNAVDIAKCTMIYGAMFDEVNEGTAMFKVVADQKDLPLQAKLLPLNVEGESPENLNSDHYLWLAGETSRRLRNGIRFTSNMPTRGQPLPEPNWFRRALSRVKRRS